MADLTQSSGGVDRFIEEVNVGPSGSLGHEESMRNGSVLIAAFALLTACSTHQATKTSSGERMVPLVEEEAASVAAATPERTAPKSSAIAARSPRK